MINLTRQMRGAVDDKIDKSIGNLVSRRVYWQAKNGIEDLVWDKLGFWITIFNISNEIEEITK